jgi:uncharacterized protein (TIGR02270 family)
MSGDALVLWDVVEERLDEAGFLWGAWERALASARLTVREVAQGVEDRLLSNIEALALACPAAAERLLPPALGDGDPQVVSAAALTLLETPPGFAIVHSALAAAESSERAPLARALVLSRRPGLEREVAPLVCAENPDLAVAALDVLAVRRVDPGPDLSRLIAAPLPELAAAALRAARTAARPVGPAVDRALVSPSALVRDAAIETGLILGFRSAYRASQRAVARGEAEAGFALAVLAMGGDARDLPLLEGALDVPALAPAAIEAHGIAGRPSAIGRLVEGMREPALARLAGEAFENITGIPIAGELESAAPEADEEPDLDADLRPSQDAELPVPDAEAVAARWSRQAPRLDPAVAPPPRAAFHARGPVAGFPERHDAPAARARARAGGQGPERTPGRHGRFRMRAAPGAGVAAGVPFGGAPALPAPPRGVTSHARPRQPDAVRGRARAPPRSQRRSPATPSAAGSPGARAAWRGSRSPTSRT